MKINKKFIICGIITLSICFLQIISILNAPSVKASSLWDAQDKSMSPIGQKFGEDSRNPTDIRTVTVNIIKIFLTILGIIFMIMIIFAGFKWMTASGNDEKVKEARSQITAAIIGMVIVLAAFIITNFVVTRIEQSISGKIWPG